MTTREFNRLGSLPVSTFIVVAMWTALESLLITLTHNFDTKSEAELIAQSIYQGGILASLLMALAWLIFGIASSDDSKTERVHVRCFNSVIVIASLMICLVILTSEASESRVIKRAIAGVLMLTAGMAVPWLLMRHYFRVRLIHRNQEPPKTNGRSEVSIGKLMMITAILASLMGIGRLIVGDLESRILLHGIAGCMLSLLWWSTAIWIVGRRRFVIVTFGMFVVIQLAGFAMTLPDATGSGDELIASGAFVASVQTHLILFLAMMRASQFQFVRLRTNSCEVQSPAILLPSEITIKR